MVASPARVAVSRSFQGSMNSTGREEASRAVARAAARVWSHAAGNRPLTSGETIVTKFYQIQALEKAGLSGGPRQPVWGGPTAMAGLLNQ